MHYEKITTEILEKLKAIVGPKDVVTDADAMQPYSHDEVTEPAYHHMPEAVVFAETAQQVSAIVKRPMPATSLSSPRGPARVQPAAPSRNTAASSCRWKR